MEQKTLQELVHADARTDGKGVVPDYGDEKAEYDVLIEGCGLVDRSARGKLEVTGEDRARFLHGMLTNAVETLAEGEGNHSALTDPKGSTQADLHLYHRGDAFWAETEPELQVKVRGAGPMFWPATAVSEGRYANAKRLTSRWRESPFP